PRRDALAGLVATAIGADSTATAGDDATWAVRTFFEHLARRRPLLLVFDDVQWADPALQRLLHALAGSTNQSAVLLLCIARPELLDDNPSWGGGIRSAFSLPLQSMAHEEVSLLIGNLLGSEAIPGAVVDHIAAAADGNPLYVEEFLTVLIDDG